MLTGISSSLSGLNNAATRLSDSADRIAKAGIAPAQNAQTNNTDISIDAGLVNSKLSAISYTASAKVLKVQLDIEKEILNILT
jgi:hypothetical protein